MYRKIIAFFCVFSLLFSFAAAEEEEVHFGEDDVDITELLNIVQEETVKDKKDSDGAYIMTVTCTGDVLIGEAGASMAGVQPGDTLTLRDLLYGLMIPSGNDAANVLANAVAGSVPAFVDMMNENCKALGISETSHFANCVGIYDDANYSTVMISQ